MESLLNRRHYMLWTSFHHNAPYYLLHLDNGETRRQISLV